MILQNAPLLDGNESIYVRECLQTNWISSQGKYVTDFENRFAELCGAKFARSCCNGTAALHLALTALEIGFGDEVIVPDFTLIADSNMVILSGAKPVFVDVDPQTWCLDLSKIEEKITPRTRAIICVHMYGHPCDMDRLLEIAQKYGLYVIEDAAQGHGTLYKGKPVGALAHIGCFSFYATKTLTTGEGGMVVTNSEELDHKVSLIRSHGFEGDARNYRHNVFGFNYRLTNIQAAIGLAQCETLSQKVAAKRRNFEYYRDALDGIEGLSFQNVASWAYSTFWNCGILVGPNFGVSRDSLLAVLETHKIQARLPFKPLHSQPVYLKSADPRYPSSVGEYPVAEQLGANLLCLPSGTGLSNEQLGTVVQAVLSARGL